MLHAADHPKLGWWPGADRFANDSYRLPRSRITIFPMKSPLTVALIHMIEFVGTSLP